MGSLVRQIRALFAVAALAVACTSPTLPLPPPASPSISRSTEPDTWRLSSDKGAEPNALIVVVSRNEGLSREERVTGTLADEQGSWQADVKGAAGDVLDISQESGSTRSPTTTIQLK